MEYDAVRNATDIIMDNTTFVSIQINRFKMVVLKWWFLTKDKPVAFVCAVV